jgi:hypothetical protein
MVSTNGGVTWTPGTSPSDSAGLYAVTCATATHCLATADLKAGQEYPSLLHSTNGGGALSYVSWNGVTGPPTCASSSACFEFDSGGYPPVPIGGPLYRSSDGGGHWAPVLLGKWAWVSAIACYSQTACYVVGYLKQLPESQLQIGRVVAGGRSIEPIGQMPFRTSSQPWVGMSCTSARYCMAAVNTDSAYRILVTRDGGVNWVSHTLPNRFGDPDQVGCTAAGRCVLVGGAYVAVITSDDARNWHVRNPMPLGTSGYGPSLSCHRGAACVIVWGDTAFLGSQGLMKWTAHLVS